MKAILPNSMPTISYDHLDEKARRKAAAIAHFQTHPEDYIRKIIGAEPDPQQIPVLQAMARPRARVLLVGANGIGKDAISAWLTEWFLACFATETAHARVPSTSASGRQVGLLWREINAWTSRSKMANKFDLFVQRLQRKEPELSNSFAWGFKAANANVMEGPHAPKMLYIMTEARGVPEWGYLAMYKACADYDNRIFAQSVPGEEVGEFFAIASGKLGLYSEANPTGWQVFFLPAAKQISTCTKCGTPFTEGKLFCECGRSCYVPTSPRVTQESIDEKLVYGADSPWFVGPVLAQFIKGSSLNLVSLSEYREAENRYGELTDGPPDVLGVDVAWTGQNFTSLCHRRGPNVEKFIRYQGVRETETARIVIQWLCDHPNGTAVIESGIAQAGVIDIVTEAELGDRLVLVNPGGPPLGDSEQFVNRRSELYYYLQQRFKLGTIAIRDKNAPLGGQLTSIRAKIRGDMKFEMESKAEMARRGIPSPDDADGLMLAMAVASDGEAGVATMDDLEIGGVELPELDW